PEFSAFLPEKILQFFFTVDFFKAAAYITGNVCRSFPVSILPQVFPVLHTAKRDRILPVLFHHADSLRIFNFLSQTISVDQLPGISEMNSAFRCHPQYRLRTLFIQLQGETNLKQLFPVLWQIP